MLDGWNTIYASTEVSIKLCAERVSFFEGYADIEKQYSQRIAKLVANTRSNISRMGPTGRDVGTSNDAWEATLNSVEKLGVQHGYVAEVVERDAYRVLDKFVGDLERRQKKLVNEGKRIQKEFKQMLDEFNKKKQAYMDAAKAADAAESNHNIAKTDPSSAPRAQQRHTEAQAKLSAADREYRSSIKDTNHRQAQHYTYHQPGILTDFESMERDRLHQLKEVATVFAGAQSTLPPAYTANIAAITSTVEALDVEGDMQTWLYANQTGRTTPPDFQYVSFKQADAVALPELAPAPPPPAEPVEPVVEEDPPPPPPPEEGP